MPRQPRIWFPGALYHVTVRGNNREPIFLTEADYRRYLKLLAQGMRLVDARLLAYALMTNHVHLMVQTGPVHPISKLMQSLGTAYTMYVNHKYERVGHVFQGRYHSVLVEKDSYALELTRYIHLNPVRARMVRAPEQYRWSSYRAYLGKDDDRLVDTEDILSLISPSTAEQRPFYQQFVLEGMARRDALLDRLLAANSILGTPEFIARIKEGAKPLAQYHALSTLGA